VLEIERKSQVINNVSRLVQGSPRSTLNSSAKTMNSLKQRCEACPRRGCRECPLYGIGEHPVYVERMKMREAKKKEKKKRENRRTAL